MIRGPGSAVPSRNQAGGGHGGGKLSPIGGQYPVVVGDALSYG